MCISEDLAPALMIGIQEAQKGRYCVKVGLSAVRMTSAADQTSISPSEMRITFAKCIEDIHINLCTYP